MLYLNHKFYLGDSLEVLRALPSESVNCCVTSPPYWSLRDYGVEGQLGLEKTPEEYVARMVEVFREVRRVLRRDGTVWCNLGDSYANDTKWGGQSGEKNYTSAVGGYGGQRLKRHTGLKPKDLIGIPWRVALALQADGYYLRSDIIWSKPNAMPESVTDRPTKAHEYIFLLAKAERYYYDAAAIKEETAPRNDSRPFGNAGGNRHGDEGKTYTAYTFARKTATEGKPGAPKQHREDRDDIEYFGIRNKRDVWTVATEPFPGAHFATFPQKLIEPCILAGCPSGGVVLDPFGGAGTTSLVAARLNRSSIYIDLSPAYRDMAIKRVREFTDQLTFEAEHRIEIAG